MTGFFQEYWGSLLVGAILLAIVVLIVIKLIRDKRAGRHSCGGDCGNCGACGSCSREKYGGQDKQ